MDRMAIQNAIPTDSEKTIVFREVSLEHAMQRFDWNEITKRVYVRISGGNVYSKITHLRPAGKGAVVSHSLGLGYNMMRLGDSVFVEVGDYEPPA